MRVMEWTPKENKPLPLLFLLPFQRVFLRLLSLWIRALRNNWTKFTTAESPAFATGGFSPVVWPLWLPLQQKCTLLMRLETIDKVVDQPKTKMLHNNREYVMNASSVVRSYLWAQQWAQIVSYSRVTNTAARRAADDVFDSPNGTSCRLCTVIRNSTYLVLQTEQFERLMI